MGAGDRQEAEAMAGNKRKDEATASDAETGKKRKEEVSASPSSKKKKKKILPEWRKHAIPCKGSDILKKKKLAFGSMCLWKLRDVLGAMESWRERQAKAEADEEAAIAAGMMKKKKVVKTRVPNGRVEFMMKHPFTTADPLSDEKLAKCSTSYRQLHRLAKFIDRKVNNYEQILIDQYIKQGYTEDESEITNDDDDE